MAHVCLNFIEKIYMFFYHMSFFFQHNISWFILLLSSSHSSSTLLYHKHHNLENITINTNTKSKIKIFRSVCKIQVNLPLKPKFKLISLTNLIKKIVFQPLKKEFRCKNNQTQIWKKGMERRMRWVWYWKWFV